MTNLDTLSEKQQQAILEGLSFLCRIFWGPDPQLCQAILEGKYLRPFELLSSLLNYDPPDLLLQLTGSTAKYADSQALYQYLEMHYVRLFINSREGITAPLYQSCYDDNALSDNRPTLMGAAAVKMKQRLDAVGLSLAENLHDLPDHLCIELEYLYYLIQKGFSENDQNLVSEAQDFAGITMLPWTNAFGQLLSTSNRCPFYSLSAALLIFLLAFVAGRENEY